MSTETLLGSDIYELTQYVNEIKSKFIDIPENTLCLGIFGYMSEMETNVLQNAIVMASEYSNEAIPVRAKFERNIIAHALSLGIKKINAKPSYMRCLMCIPEEYLLLNMKDNKFIYDRFIKIMIGNYEFHTDYDIIIKRTQIPNGDFVYTAMYDIPRKSPISNITNPYFKPLGKIKVTNINLIVLDVEIRQVTHTKIEKRILVDNPLDNKIINFDFDKQLVAFDIEVKEGDKTYYLSPVYDGLYDFSVDKYFNYIYIDSNTIRIKFNRNSYMPRINCDVTINVYTCDGSEGNFTYKEDIMMDLHSDRFSYDRLFMILKPTSDALDGIDRKSIDELKRDIPKEALSRGCITTYTDLNNFFNSLNNDNCRLYFLEKVHNQLERLYYSYLLLKKDNNIVPTNTINVNVNRNNFDNISNSNYTLKPGAVIYYDTLTASIKMNPTQDELLKMEKDAFVYINPFLVIVNKSPLYVSYFMNIINQDKYLSFEYINKNSQIQFICSKINVKREFFTDRDTYKINVELLQNINRDFGLVVADSNGNVIQNNIKVLLMLYDKSGKPYRYATSDITQFDNKEFIYTFQSKFSTNDFMDIDNNMQITKGLYDIKSDKELNGWFPSNVKARLYILVKTPTDNGRDDLDNYVPGLAGWTLTNKYDVMDGIDLYYNFTNIVTSYATLKKNPDTSLTFSTHKMPVVRKSYIDSEKRIQDFAKILIERMHYLDYCLLLLEDSFGVDFKFFNTYGPSELYNIDNESLLNKVNLSLTFELKLVTIADKYITEYITTDIKNYMENINNISDLHMPNLITYITNKYRQQLVYFKFIDMNGYGPVKQSIYKVETNTDYIISTTVPEFLNVNTLGDGSPDIRYIIVP